MRYGIILNFPWCKFGGYYVRSDTLCHVMTACSFPWLFVATFPDFRDILGIFVELFVIWMPAGWWMGRTRGLPCTTRDNPPGWPVWFLPGKASESTGYSINLAVLSIDCKNPCMCSMLREANTVKYKKSLLQSLIFRNTLIQVRKKLIGTTMYFHVFIFPGMGSNGITVTQFLQLHMLWEL